ILKIEKEAIEGNRIRAKDDGKLELQGVTSYYSNLEKERGQQKFIKTTKEETLNYYSSLYDKKVMKLENWKMFDKYIKKITQGENILLNKEITETEVYNVIKKMNKGKSPGPDGLQFEFYHETPSIIPSLTKKLNEWKLGNMNKDNAKSYIRLLGKEG